jgi:hypothetical protein
MVGLSFYSHFRRRNIAKSQGDFCSLNVEFRILGGLPTCHET